MYLLDRFDFAVRDHRQTVPSVAENFHEASRLGHVAIARFVHRVVKEEIAGKHGDPDPPAHALTPRPYINHGEERVKSLVLQLIVDELFGVAEGPEDVPLRRANGRVFESVELVSRVSW